jgi:hypothetical protein
VDLVFWQKLSRRNVGMRPANLSIVITPFDCADDSYIVEGAFLV